MRNFCFKITVWIIIILLFLNLLLNVTDSWFGLKHEESYILDPTNNKSLRYIFYNSDNYYASKWDAVFGRGKEPFKRCKYSNCYLLADSSPNIPSEKYAAGIFHMRNNCGLKDVERIKAVRGRLSGPFIMYLMESAIYDCRINLESYNGIFNWTMNYHPDADIVVTYGRLYKLKTKGFPLLNIQQTLKKKTRLAFWLISHKGSNGGRDKYAIYLREYMPFDQYGTSSEHKCPQGKNMSCKELLAVDYKFYFSFENSLCTDYVTEKFFVALSLPVVPVVYGKGNYTSISPSHSFIDVRDFKGPKELAEYLLYLDKNDTAYGEYLQWKVDGEYRVSSLADEKTEALCTLCKRLNNLDTKQAYSADELNAHWRGTKDNPVCSDPIDLIPGLKE